MQGRIIFILQPYQIIILFMPEYIVSISINENVTIIFQVLDISVFVLGVLSFQI